MIKVNKDTFYAYVNPRDIVVNCVRTSPYIETEFRTRSGIFIGRTIDTFENYDESDNNYYLTSEVING